jgi:1-acyl-sn-glycerol-3-phosphate acyltransferase
MTSLIRLVARLLFSAIVILLITVMMSITWALRARRFTRTIMQQSFRIGAAAIGIRVKVVGQPADARPSIIVSNHFSYLDLFVLGSIVPVAFTPKREIRSWPVLGFMCRASGCLFIDRRTSQTLENKKHLEEALKAGDIISLFPEGTTNEGTQLLPFKSSFFSLALETGIPVQPVSIFYTKFNGRAVTPADYPSIGWYGDALFFPHLVRFLKQESLDATLMFHAPVNPSQFASRKELALYCRDIIEKGIEGVG